MKAALEQAQEIARLGMGEVDVAGVPPRWLAELSRYGVDGKASLLRRHGDARRLATLLATAVHLTTRAWTTPWTCWTCWWPPGCWRGRSGRRRRRS